MNNFLQERSPKPFLLLGAGLAILAATVHIIGVKLATGAMTNMMGSVGPSSFGDHLVRMAIFQAITILFVLASIVFLTLGIIRFAQYPVARPRAESPNRETAEQDEKKVWDLKADR